MTPSERDSRRRRLRGWPLRRRANGITRTQAMTRYWGWKKKTSMISGLVCEVTLMRTPTGICTTNASPSRASRPVAVHGMSRVSAAPACFLGRGADIVLRAGRGRLWTSTLTGAVAGRAGRRRLLVATYSSSLRTAMNASWGISTLPTRFMRFLPSFCFSSSLRLRVMSPP